MNHLRQLLEANGRTQADLARHLGVTPGAASNWVQGRDLPRPAHRLTVAEWLEVQISDIWPELDSADDPTLGLVKAYGIRADVPPETWPLLFTETEPGDTLELHGFAVALFPAKVPRFWDVIRGRELAGVQIRLSMIDPDCEAALRRSEEENFDFDGRARKALAEFQENIGELPGVEIRIHDRPLDLSVYANDSLAIVTTHLWGAHGEEAPTFICRSVLDKRSFYRKYLDHARRVWDHEARRVN